MKIERDTAHILSGVRQGMTIGSPISILLENKDWKNWQESLPVGEGDLTKHKRVASPRPGHADLAGPSSTTFLRLAMYWNVPQPVSRRHGLPLVLWRNCSCTSSALRC